MIILVNYNWNNSFDLYNLNMALKIYLTLFPFRVRSINEWQRFGYDLLRGKIMNLASTKRIENPQGFS